LLIFMAGCAELNRSFVEIVGLMGCAGFGGAIGVHFVVGYVDFLHLLPAFIGFLLFAVAETMLWVGWRQIRSQVRNSQVEEGATRIAR
jgi:uncharacterized membrane protein